MTKKLKRPVAFLSAFVMVMAMLLYFPSGMFSNIDWGLTASAEGVTFTATAGTEGASGESYDKLIDGKYTEDDYSKWCVTGFKSVAYGGDGAYIIFSASEPILVTGYSIVTGNDNEAETGRNPKSWTLYGCNDSSAGRVSDSWEVIDAVTNDKQLEDKNYTKYNYPLDSTIAYEEYQYFKLEITATQGSDVMQMSEFILTDCEHNWENTGNTIAPTCTEVGYDVYECSICHWQKKVPTDVALGHDFVDGACTRCGAYEISNVDQLYRFAGLVNGTLTDGTPQNKSANAVLTKDITVNEGVLKSDGTLNSGSFRSWTPIGTDYSKTYTGTFDGQNHKISGLYFSENNTNFVGLFGYVGSGGEISNVSVVDSYFSGYQYVSGVCGVNYGSITNCYNKGTVSGSDWYVGGVCGNNHGTITGCYNKGTVSGSNWYVGGVCGRLESGTITNCYNLGTVSGSKRYVGGVCGYIKSGTIANCYNLGTVSGSTDHVGGVCGYNYEGTIAKCYNTGEVSGSNYCGGVCGRLESGTITNCYYLDTCNAEGTTFTCLEGESKTTAQFGSGEVAYLLQGENGSVWGQTIGTEDYPVLGGKKVYYYNEAAISIPFYSNYVSAAYNATDARYEISSADQLYWYADCVNNGNTSVNAVLKDNIVVNTGDVAGCNGTKAEGWIDWTPVGNDPNMYTGIFDGNNKTISGLYFNNESTNSVGLFGCSIGTIKNAGVVNSYFNGNVCVGGVCGYNGDGNTQGTIENCYNTGTVSGSDYVGGICGVNYSGTVKKCYNTGNVNATNTDSQIYFCAGGVCGANESIIQNCHNTGNVTATGEEAYVGGVCGDDCGETSNSYNTGNVTANGNGAYVGGICGSGVVMTNCYNTGAVTANGADAAVGGLSGYDKNGIITNCYNTGNASATGANAAVGSLCGENYSDENDSCTIENCYYGSGEPFGKASETDTVENVGIKTTEQFGIGEVAYLLQSGQTADYNGKIPEVWGQTLGTDSYPVIGGKKVLTNIDQSEFANDVMIYGQNVVLDGTIGMNILVAADDAYEWSAKIDDVEVAKPDKDEKGLYKFTCKVAAKDMAKNIEFYINDDVKATVSVSDYLTELKNSEGEDTPLANLVTAMETYGTAADAFFSNGTVAAPTEEVTAENLSGYTFTKNDAPEGISYYGSSLLLKSETTVRHYFKLADGKDISDFTFTVNGVTAEPTEKQGYYYIDIENISADKLGTSHIVKIGENEVISNYSALSYAYAVLNSDTADENLKNLVKALYLYNRAAVGYNVKTGWVQDGENWYYYDDNGIMQTGWVTNIPGFDDARFYFNDDGIMQTGWVQDGENWYYLNDDGTLLTNSYTPDGYYVDENGIWIPGK